MALLLTNDDVEDLLSMEECLSVLEEAYRAHGQGRAVSPPIVQTMTEARGRYGVRGPVYHSLRSMPGAVEELHMASVRIDSDIVHWPGDEGQKRRVKIPAADGQYLGLILLFDTDTGHLRAIIPDGVVQALRVGATCGLGAKYLSRMGASKLALIGTGWQARTHLAAVAAVRPLSEVRVFSTNGDHRARFIEQMSREVSCPLVPVSTFEEAACGADMVVSATNALTPTVQGDFLEDGMYVCTVRDVEMDDVALGRAGRIVTSRLDSLWYDYSFEGEGEKIPEFHGQGKNTVEKWGQASSANWNAAVPLGAVIAGRAKGRMGDGEIIYFDNKGDGLQCTAVGARLYEKARAVGVGRELPDDWFLQPYHP